MGYTYNPNTRRFEDENGNPAPAGAVPEDAPPQAKPFTLNADEGVPLDAIQRVAPQTPVEIKRPSGTVSGEKPAETLQRRGGATAQTASLTSHVGGTSVNTPIGPEGIVQRTSGGSSISRPIVTDEERQANKERDEREAEVIRKAEEKERVRAAAAEVAAGEKALIQIQKQNEIERVGQAGDAELKRLMATAQDDEARWKQAALESTDARNTFWARQDTGYKIRAGIAMILGVVGGALTDGRNSGVEAVQKTIEQDEARFRQKAENAEKILARSRGNVSEERAKIKEQLANIDLRTAVAFDTAAAQAEARARKLGIDEESIKANTQIQALYGMGDEHRAKWFEQTRGRVTTESARTIATGQASGTGPAGKPLASEAAERIATIGGGLDSVTRLREIIARNPGAWEEYRANQERWQRNEAVGKVPGLQQLRGAAQVGGLMNVAPEQGLKSEDAREIHRLQTELNSSIAKARGGAITEADVKATESEQATLATSPAEKLKQLGRVSRRLEGFKSVHLGGRTDPTAGMVGPAAATTPAAQATPSGPPVPGAIRKTHKTAGPGWLAPDGMFYTDAEIAQMAGR